MIFGHLDLMEHGSVFLVGFYCHQLIFKAREFGPKKVNLAFESALAVGHFLHMRNALLVCGLNALKLILKTLNFAGNIEGFFLQTDNL